MQEMLLALKQVKLIQWKRKYLAKIAYGGKMYDAILAGRRRPAEFKYPKISFDRTLLYVQDEKPKKR